MIPLRHLSTILLVLSLSLFSCGSGVDPDLTSNKVSGPGQGSGQGSGSGGKSGPSNGSTSIKANPIVTPGPRPFGLQRRTVVSGLTFPLDRGTAGQIKLVTAFPKLKFSQPLFLTYAPDGSDRIFVVQKGGKILVFPNNPQASTSKVFLDLSKKIFPYGERGLLGMAFQPDYVKSGVFYVYYSTPGTHYSIVARYKVSSNDPNKADPNSEQIIFRLRQPYGNHNGGMIAFGPDQMLYIGLGDGGSGGDPQDNGQNLATLLGAILRIDPKNSSTYSIPKDNPFAGNNKGWKQEIWAYGLRNPWRFSFDRKTGDLWAGDVGQNAVEEIDLVTKGGNYGWRLMEGNRRFGSSRHKAPTPPIPPVIDILQSTGLARSITGGYVYRGTRIQKLQGKYLYGDYVTGNIWVLSYDKTNKKVLSNTKAARLSSLASFGEDQNGELYAISLNGTIMRIEDGGNGNTSKIPKKLSQTGVFKNLRTLTPTPGLIEYRVNTILWSDGTKKRRWIALPGTSKIGFDLKNPNQPWTFPVGTVLIKHIEADTGGPTPTRLETRVLIHEKQGWAGYTYRWNAAQTDADFLPNGGSTTIRVRDPKAPGGFRTQTWDFPNMSQCMQCHTGAAGWALGPKTAQLNRDFPYPNATDNELRSWNHIGLFDKDIGHPQTLSRMAPLASPWDSLEKRARSYLDANCSYCHQPGAPAPGAMDMRFDTPLSKMNLVGVAPTTNNLGLPTAKRITKGKKELSVLWLRMRRLDKYRMPPLGSHVVDSQAADLIGKWIDSLK
ncbi:MAG TPA: hypothetical protein ENK02_09065 [Planctomycetes bacterium]|nr:hypothetical protein [Planctomycetota bacterium]